MSVSKQLDHHTFFSNYAFDKKDNQNSKTIMAFPAKMVRDGEAIIDRFPDWDNILNQTYISAVRSNTRAHSSSVVNNHVTTHHDSARTNTMSQPMKSAKTYVGAN